MSQLTRIDPWVLDLLVDPLAKTDLVRRDDRFASDYGWSYPLRDGVPDLRLLQASTTRRMPRLGGPGRTLYDDGPALCRGT
jgi:hypothetical protein